MRITHGPGFVIALRVPQLLWLLLTALSVARAERLQVKTYTTADGLARDHINRIVQDSRGFLWFCTSEGLSRFDGYKFTNYGTEDGLAGRVVFDFLEARNGFYWVATDKGLCRFISDPLPQATAGPARAAHRRFLVYYPGEAPKARSINAIYEDHSGTIWCCTDEGLYHADLIGGDIVFSFVDSVRPARTEDKLRIEAVTEDRRGWLWVIAESGLHRLGTDGTVELYTAAEGLPEGFSRALLEDRDGRIWVASDRGLYQLVPDPKPHQTIVARRYTMKEGLAGDGVRSLCQSWDGTLWACSWGGLSALPPGQSNPEARPRTYLESNGLIPAITSVCEDRDHNL